jgi:hypothetical protein
VNPRNNGLRNRSSLPFFMGAERIEGGSDNLNLHTQNLLAQSYGEYPHWAKRQIFLI